MLQIDWTQAPEWANFAAMDCDGEWWWYESEPEDQGFGAWVGGRMETFTRIHYSDTLTKRPTSPATLNNMDNY